MDIEAIIIIAGICAALGMILLIPGLWWAKYKAKKDQAFSKKVNFTPFGWILLAMVLLTLFGGLTMPYLAPASFIGKLTSFRHGRLIWVGLTVFVFIVLQKAFSSLGLLVEKPKAKVKDV